MQQQNILICIILSNPRPRPSYCSSPHRKRQEPVPPSKRSSGIKTTARSAGRKVGTIEDWLDHIKPGYAARFGPAWKDGGGYYDLEDVLYDANDELSLSLLQTILAPAGAKAVDLRRIAGAVRQLATFGPTFMELDVGTYEAARSPEFEPRAYSELCQWLESVKTGYARFAAAFAAAGYEDLDDLKTNLPTAEQLHQLLAGITAAKFPQIERMLQALTELRKEVGLLNPRPPAPNPVFI